jgi:hypothetical protein
MDQTSDDEFYNNAMTHSPKHRYGKINGHKPRHKALYTPVSLHEEDEKLLNEDSLYSPNQVIREEDEEDETSTANSEVDEFERIPVSSTVIFPNSTRSARSIVEGIPLVLKT